MLNSEPQTLEELEREQDERTANRILAIWDTIPDASREVKFDCIMVVLQLNRNTYHAPQ